MLQGGAVANATGFVGQAFSMDGNAGYVQVPDAAIFHPTNLTIEAWVKFTGLDSTGNSQAGQQYIVFKQNSRSSQFEGFSLTKTRVSSKDYFDFTVASATGASVDMPGVTQIAAGTWYHVLAIRGVDYIQLYVNGKLEAQKYVGFAQDYGTNALYFGTTGQSGWDHKFYGLLDEVSLYNRVLSGAEISAIYAAGASGKCKGLNITTQPQSQTLLSGGSTGFSVEATGTPPLAWQWRVGGIPSSGATNATVALSNVQSTNSGNYTVVVTDAGSSLTSSVAVLTVLVPPTITQQPQGATNDPGTTAGFAAAATGTAPLNYQWRLNGVNLIEGGRISGAGSNSVTISSVQASDAGNLVLVVTNVAGAVTSAVATLAVTGPAVITLQPTNQSVTAGSDVLLSARGAGTPPLSYQWLKNGGALSDGGNRSGVNTAGLLLAGAQTNDAGNYQVVIANDLNSVTSSVAVLAVSPAAPPSPQSAGAVVLVNSHSAGYADFQRFIQPYLGNFGFPYTIQDISTNAPGAALSNCAVIIIGHNQLDTNLTYLTPAAQAAISLAVSNGTGLVNFDNNLTTGAAGRYTFVQNIFGFTYGSATSVSSASFPPTEPGSQMHFVTARHAANDTVSFRSSVSLPGFTSPAGVTNVVTAGGKPLVVVKKYGQGRAVQWCSYGWMLATVLGPVDGLDDVMWRGVVWAARKPFVMRGLPNFVSMRIDDAVGPFGWVHDANMFGFKPFIALFYSNVTESSALDLKGLTTSGNATASIHAFNNDVFFYFNHGLGQPWPTPVVSNNFYAGALWHTNHGIPISKVCATHFSEIGVNAFQFLSRMGMEYVPIEVVPGSIEYSQTPPTPWLLGGPYRLYETPSAGELNWPTFYCDWLSVPGHPEMDGKFFNYYSEVRDVASCGEWCPDSDVAGSTSRGTKMVKRTLDSMVPTTLFSHEWYVGSVNTVYWQATLQGLTNNLAAYRPIYVTVDFLSQYARALRTSRMVTADFNPTSGQVSATLAGKTDLDTSYYVFTGADGGITNVSVAIPVFNGAVTSVVAVLPPVLAAPIITQQPANQTVLAGGLVNLSIGVVGTTPLAYQWQFDGTGLGGGQGGTLSLTNVQPGQAGGYSVLVSNSAGAVTSVVAIITVADRPSLSGVGATSNGVFSFSIGGPTGLVYQIEATTDFTNWTVAGLVTNTTGQANFLEATASGASGRFYRARWVP